MSIRYVIAILVLAGSCTVNGQESNEARKLVASRDGSPGEALATFINDHEDDLADISVCDRDVIYGRKDGMALTLDVYQPLRKRNRRAVICIISAGYWSGPEYRKMPFFTSKIRFLVDRGFTVFAVIHGSQPRYSLLEISNDVHRSVRFVRHRAQSYKIDPSHIGLFGESSGGHLALLAGFTEPAKASAVVDEVDRQSPATQAVIAYFPNTDLINYGKENRSISDHFREQGLAMDSVFDFRKWNPSTGVFHGMSEPQRTEALRALSPIQHVDEGDPPTLLLHGDRDRLVPIQQSQSMIDRMVEADVDCKLFVAEAQNHAWASSVPGEERALADWLYQHLQIADEQAVEREKKPSR